MESYADYLPLHFLYLIFETLTLVCKQQTFSCKQFDILYAKSCMLENIDL